jgi:tetratricopeptide (TPR) repeat protein
VPTGENVRVSKPNPRERRPSQAVFGQPDARLPAGPLRGREHSESPILTAALATALAIAALTGCASATMPDRAHAEEALLRATDLHGAGFARDAERGYLEAVALDPSYAFAYYRLGVLSMQWGRFGSAEAHFRRAIRVDPEFVRGYYELGLLRLRMRDHKVAVALLERAHRLAPNDPEVGAALAAARSALRVSEGEDEREQPHQR